MFEPRLDRTLNFFHTRLDVVCVGAFFSTAIAKAARDAIDFQGEKQISPAWAFDFSSTV